MNFPDMSLTSLSYLTIVLIYSVSGFIDTLCPAAKHVVPAATLPLLPLPSSAPGRMRRLVHSHLRATDEHFYRSEDLGFNNTRLYDELAYLAGFVEKTPVAEASEACPSRKNKQDEVSFVVYGEPVALARHRSTSRGIMYNPISETTATFSEMLR